MCPRPRLLTHALSSGVQGCVTSWIALPGAIARLLANFEHDAVRPRERRKPCLSHPCNYKGIRTLQRGRSLANVGSRCDAFLGGADERRVASLTHIGTEQSAQLVLAHGAAVLIVKVRGIQRILRSELNAFPVQLGASFVILFGVLSGARLGAICEAPRKPFWDPSGIHFWPYLEGIFGQN